MKIYAHRGASGDYQDNTLLSFEMAIAQGADGIELDVFEADGELYIFHDRFLDKLGLPGVLTEDALRVQISSLRVDGEHPVPTLRGALEKIAGRCTVNIELKGIRDFTLLVDAVSEALNSFNFVEKQFLVSAFDHPMLLKAKELLPALDYAFLTASIPVSFDTFEQHAITHWHVDVNVLNKEAVARAHLQGIAVRAYIVDREYDLVTLQSWGVDGVFTNFPKRSRAILASHVKN